jgi:hypothetical protein
VRAVCVDKATGVVWFGTAAGINRYDPNYVAPIPPALSKLELLLYPNPLSLTRMGLELRLRGNTTAYSGEILDLGGRVVRKFSRALARLEMIDPGWSLSLIKNLTTVFSSARRSGSFSKNRFSAPTMKISGSQPNVMLRGKSSSRLVLTLMMRAVSSARSM